MRLLFVSNYFPPEVNAPAVRLYEHAKQWVADGHDVEVLASVPNFPEGEVYKGYENRFVREHRNGIDVMRVPMYVTANEGTLKRTLSYVSFMLSAVWFSRRVLRRPDIVVATSPQFFAAIGGYLISLIRRIPFVLEVRDLWPESIVAVGAVKRNWVIRLFERIELYLYRHSDHIVVVTDAFKRYIEAKGIPSRRISVIKNGFDLETLAAELDAAKVDALKREHHLEEKFVASYIGTIGMAHGVEVMLEAARLCEDPDVVFLVMGTGAERPTIERLQAKLQLPNVRLIDKQPRELVPYFLALSNVSVVHLRKSPLFKTVIPSKIFEAMAMRKPIVLGVEGETKDIIEEAGAGIPVTPEDPAALLNAILKLKADSNLYGAAAAGGFSYVHRHHDRRKLARRYWSILEEAKGSTPATEHRFEPATAGV